MLLLVGEVVGDVRLVCEVAELCARLRASELYKLAKVGLWILQEAMRRVKLHLSTAVEDLQEARARGEQRAGAG